MFYKIFFPLWFVCMIFLIFTPGCLKTHNLQIAEEMTIEIDEDNDDLEKPTEKEAAQP